jgi:hypothetical protein
VDSADGLSREEDCDEDKNSGGSHFVCFFR